MVLIALLYLNVYVYRLVIVGHDRVSHDMRITITMLIVLTDEQLLIFVVKIGNKLLRAEEMADVALLIGLLHRPLQLLLIECVVSGDIYLVDLHLFLLVHINVKNKAIRFGYIITLDDIYLGILEAFLIIITLNGNLCSVNHVRRNLVALSETQFCLQILLF